MAQISNKAQYDFVLLCDLAPEPGFPHVYPESIERASLPADIPKDFKLTKDLRLTVIRLPIYADCHYYHIIAKIEMGSTCNERNRAARAVNDFLSNQLKAGCRLDEAVEQVIEAFPPRVLKRQMYVPKGEYQPPSYTSQRSRQRPMVSSDDFEPILPRPPPPCRKRTKAVRDPAVAEKSVKLDKADYPPQSCSTETASSTAKVQMTKTLTPLFIEDPDPEPDPALPTIDEAHANPNPLLHSVSLPVDPQDMPVTQDSPPVPSPPPPSANAGLTKPTASSSDTALATPVARQYIGDGKYQKLMERIDTLQSKEDLRYDFTAATIKHMSRTLDNLQELATDIKAAIKVLSAATVEQKAVDISIFPLHTTDEVDALAIDRSKQRALIAR